MDVFEPVSLEEAERDLYDYRTLKDKVEAHDPGTPGSIIWWRPHSNEPSSPLERHVIKWEDALRTIAAVDRLMHRLGRWQRRLVRLRYFESRQWADVATLLHTSERNVLRWRTDVLRIYVDIRDAQRRLPMNERNE